MKAAVLNEYKQFQWIDREIGDPGAGEVQVKVSFASICGTDMHIFNGDFHPRTPVPFIPGHEVAGTVEKTGPDVSGYAIGDKVAIDPLIWCGECQACKANHYPACSSLQLIGIDMDGGFCEYINVNHNMLYKAPDQVPEEHLALTEIYGIGFHACNRAGVIPGDSLAIWGAGRVGQVILQAARTITDASIYMVDILDKRLRIAAEAYDDIIPLNALEVDPVKAIQEHTGGNGTDIAFEAVGHQHLPDRTLNPVRGAIQSIRGGGRVCVLGLTDDPAPVVFKELIWKEASIIASRVSHGEYPTIIDQLSKGALKPEALITTIMPGEKIQEAFEKVEKDPGNYLKILLQFGDL
jgi:threonine dehydrogenase-like Zn-dependent dehydrogenase